MLMLTETEHLTSDEVARNRTSITAPARLGVKSEFSLTSQLTQYNPLLILILFVKVIKVFTHHKTGTIFWFNCIKKLSIKHGLSCYNGQDELFHGDFTRNADIYFNHHSNYIKPALKSMSPDGIHSYRNPARIIISCVKYHLKSKESWLHIPRNDFNGLTYRQMLESQNSFDEQVTFEINHAAGMTIFQMMKAINELPFEHVDIDLISTDKNMSSLRLVYLRTSFSNLMSMEDFLLAMKSECIWNMDNTPNHGTSKKDQSLQSSIELISQKNRDLFLEKFGQRVYEFTFN